MKAQKQDHATARAVVSLDLEGEAPAYAKTLRRGVPAEPDTFLRPYPPGLGGRGSCRAGYVSGALLSLPAPQSVALQLAWLTWNWPPP